MAPKRRLTEIYPTDSYFDNTPRTKPARTQMTPDQVDAERLTEEDMQAASDYLEKRHIIERHSEELYEAVIWFQDSIRDELNNNDLPHIRLNYLRVDPLHKAANKIKLDLYNKGLRDKP